MKTKIATKIGWLCIFTSIPAFAADLWSLPMDRIAFDSKLCAVNVKIEIDGPERKLSSMRVTVNGKEHVVPVSEFDKLIDVSLETLRVEAASPNVRKGPIDWKENALILILTYGSSVERRWTSHGIKHEETKRSVAHFVFSEIGYAYRSRSVPIEDSGSAHIYFKEANEKEVDQGVENGAPGEPYDLDDPPFEPIKEIFSGAQPSRIGHTTSIRTEPNKPVIPPARSPVVEPESTAPTHHL